MPQVYQHEICDGEMKVILYFIGRFKLAAEDQRKALSLEPDFQSAQQCLEQCIKELSKQQTAS